MYFDRFNCCIYGKYSIEQIDPYLELVDDIRLQAVCVQPNGGNKGYGSQYDDVSALKSLSAIELYDQELKEIVISYFMTMAGKFSEVIDQLWVP